jgi:hypothetical protein
MATNVHQRADSTHPSELPAIKKSPAMIAWNDKNNTGREISINHGEAGLKAVMFMRFIPYLRSNQPVCHQNSGFLHGEHQVKGLIRGLISGMAINRQRSHTLTFNQRPHPVSIQAFRI